MQSLVMVFVLFVLLLIRAAFMAKRGSCAYRLSAGPSALARQQRVEERIHTRVPVSQPCEDAIDGHLRAHRHRTQHIRAVERQELPDPKRKKASPERYHDAQDEEQNFGARRTRRVGVAPSRPGRLSLRHPVESPQGCIQSSDGQSWA